MSHVVALRPMTVCADRAMILRNHLAASLRPGPAARRDRLHGRSLEVFAYAATISKDLAARVETEMTGQELAAVAIPRPRPTSTKS